MGFSQRLTVESLAEKITNHQKEQSQLQIEMRNIIDQNEQYSQCLNDMKDNSKTLLSENKSLQKNLKLTQEKFEEIQKEAQSLQKHYFLLKETEAETKSRCETALEQNAELNTINQNFEKELQDWMCSAESNAALVESLQKQIRQLSSEKHDFEILLSRVYAFIPNSDIQKVVGDMARIQKELHISQRELLTNSQNMKPVLKEYQTLSGSPNSFDKTRLVQKNLDNFEKENERLSQRIESLKKRFDESKISLKEIGNKARSIVPLDISMQESKTLREASILISPRSSLSGSEIFASSDRKYPFTPYCKSARETGLNSFANTLDKVKQSLQKYGCSSIHYE